MSFNWSGYLDLAQDLVGLTSGSSSQEAKLRCATSRAYYAAFCSARNYLRDKDHLSVPTDGSAHKFVKSQFKSSKVQSRKRVGMNLERMKINRTKADYDDYIGNLNSISSLNLALAKRVIADLKVI